LSPAPSVKAEVALEKYAYTLSVLGWVTVQVVVAVMEVLPGLTALPPIRLKLTALAESLTLSDSANSAFSAIGLAPELRTWAAAGKAAAAVTQTISAIVRARFAGFAMVAVNLLALPPMVIEGRGALLLALPCPAALLLPHQTA